MTVDNGRHLRERIPGASLVELPGAVHHPWMGDVAPVHRALDGFMRAP